MTGIIRNSKNIKLNKYTEEKNWVFIVRIIPVVVVDVTSSQQQDVTLGMILVKRSRILVSVSLWSSHLTTGVVVMTGGAVARIGSTSSCRFSVRWVSKHIFMGY